MKATPVTPSDVRYRKCPRCTVVMDRYNYGDKSGVILDRCRKHGLFLDPGEFEAIQRFIELGGHELARKSRTLRNQKAAMRKERDEVERAADPPHLKRARDPFANRLRWFGLFGW